MQEGQVVSHLNASDLRVSTHTVTLEAIYRQVKIAPWLQVESVQDVALSRLIELLLILVSPPSLYLDARDGRWLLVEGSPLLWIIAIQRFKGQETLRLRGLEFLSGLEDLAYSDLSRPLQRRLDETKWIIHLFEVGTSQAVMSTIIARLSQMSAFSL